MRELDSCIIVTGPILKSIVIFGRDRYRRTFKDQIEHDSEEMIKRYTHLRPECIEKELDRVRNFVQIDPFDLPMQPCSNLSALFSTWRSSNW